MLECRSLLAAANRKGAAPINNHNEKNMDELDGNIVAGDEPKEEEEKEEGAEEEEEEEEKEVE